MASVNFLFDSAHGDDTVSLSIKMEATDEHDATGTATLQLTLERPVVFEFPQYVHTFLDAGAVTDFLEWKLALNIASADGHNVHYGR